VLFQALCKNLNTGSVEGRSNRFAFIPLHGLTVKGEVDFLTPLKGKDRVLRNPHIRMSFLKKWKIALFTGTRR
jgi:hypothetical protein